GANEAIPITHHDASGDESMHRFAHVVERKPRGRRQLTDLHSSPPDHHIPAPALIRPAWAKEHRLGSRRIVSDEEETVPIEHRLHRLEMMLLQSSRDEVCVDRTVPL